MRRIIAVFLVAMIIFVGCSDKSGKEVNIVPADAAKTILDGFTLNDDELIEANDEVVKEWYSLDDNVSDFKVYVSSTQGTPAEIAVIKSSDIKTARETVDKRIKDLEFRFGTYRTEQMSKLNDPVIVAKGDVVIMVISDDSTQAKKIVDSLFS